MQATDIQQAAKAYAADMITAGAFPCVAQEEAAKLAEEAFTAGAVWARRFAHEAARQTHLVEVGNFGLKSYDLAPVADYIETNGYDFAKICANLSKSLYNISLAAIHYGDGIISDPEECITELGNLHETFCKVLSTSIR